MLYVSILKVIFVISTIKYIKFFYNLFSSTLFEQQEFLYIVFAIISADIGFILSSAIYFFHIKIQLYHIHAYITSIHLSLYFQLLFWIFFLKHIETEQSKLTYNKKLAFARIIIISVFTFHFIFSTIILNKLKYIGIIYYKNYDIDYYPNNLMTLYSYSIMIMFQIVAIMYIRVLAKKSTYFTIFIYYYCSQIISEIITIIRVWSNTISSIDFLLRISEITFFVSSILILVYISKTINLEHGDL